MQEARLILLVEDNSNDEMLALRALKQARVAIRVKVVHDGAEALEYLSDFAKPCPDLVLLDLKLPKLNGLEVLWGIRAERRTRYIPVVIFTSSNERSDVAGCFDCGANSFVRKSVDFGEYMDKISRLAEYWLSLNEPCQDEALKSDERLLHVL